MGRKTNTLIIVLIVLLALAIGYIGYGAYTRWKQQKDLSTFQAGANYGAQQTVAYLYQQVASCQQVPVTANNQTINVVAIQCLQG